MNPKMREWVKGKFCNGCRFETFKKVTMDPDKLFFVCLYHWFRKLAQLGGLDIFLDHFKVTPPGYVLIASLYALLLSCIWTLYEYPFDEKLMCVTFLALCFQVKRA